MNKAPIKITTQAKREVEAHRLNDNPDYLVRLNDYIIAYRERPPHGVPDRNMVRALRMMTWRNSADDWARLHACEAFLKLR